MAKKTKIRAKEKDGIVIAKVLMSHPMETGLRKDKKTGKKIPAHFIQEVIAKAGDKTVLEAFWAGGVSKNPYMSFKYKGAKGEMLTISWIDNQGGSASKSAKVK
ncbi:MAG: thiosulfate oxidation carrier complex protein SoxZ [Gammaproteobacteria bacterium]|nr:thiosulfate oxidation carrier complex protein SoxZ [Gammaproteobacteria bacterium]